MADPRMRQCQHCGQKFVLSVGQSRRDTESRRYQVFCSRDCFHASRRKPPEETAPRNDAECRGCGGMFARTLSPYCTPQCRDLVRKLRRAKIPRQCPECGSVFTPEIGSRFRVYCSIKCGRRAAKRVGRNNGKARIRAQATESVDFNKVFDRDGWRCQLCGRSTPRRLRGTIKPNAPELDHIVPISKGGAHSYLNTQCACRECNGSKGAISKGQHLLFG